MRWPRALFIVVLALAPSVAGAQGLAGPFGGLFGRTPERVGKDFTTLEFRSAAGGQYDDAILDESTPAELAVKSGATAGANSGLAFERRSDRLRVSAHGNGTHQQFFREPAFGATSYDTGAILLAKVATRLSIDASTTYRRSPFFHLLPASSGAVPLPAVLVPGHAYAARKLDNDTLDSMVGFSSPYTRRSTLSASVTRRTTRFFNEPDNNFGVWGARGMWTRKLNRDLAARIGYGREEIRQTAFGDTRFVHEVFDVGLDLAREIALDRRTALTFNTQTSIIRETGGDRRYRLNGGLSVIRAFQRTWATSVSANRTTEFLPGFLQPIFADSVSGTVSGMLAPRVEWSGTLGASRGQVGFEHLAKFITYSGTSRLSAGVTRYLGIFADYSYYHYALPAGTTSIALLPQLSRQAVSVGLSAYVPIFTRMRTPRDPR